MKCGICGKKIEYGEPVLFKQEAPGIYPQKHYFVATPVSCDHLQDVTIQVSYQEEHYNVAYATDEQFEAAHSKTSAIHADLFSRLV